MAKNKRPEAYSAVQKRVGKHIKWVRELKEPNQSAAARLIGVVPSTLNKIEEGDRAPSIFNILEIANRFRCSTDFLLRGKLVPEMDQNLALALAALHPELAPQIERMAQDTDTAPASGTRPPAKVLVSGG